MASPESRLINALEDMTREYGKNPSPALKHRIDFNRERLNKMRGNIQAKATPKKKKPVAKKASPKRIKKSDLKKRYA
tara:strand:+ start:389 stop:619 length:231 start_codon:yes stop_codon:yes gene_type:complete